MYFPISPSELAIFASLGFTALYWGLRKDSPQVSLKLESEVSEQSLLNLQNRYGYNAHSLVSISKNAKKWFDHQTNCGLTYFEQGKMRLVAGEVMGAEENIEASVIKFLEQSHYQNKLICFLPTTEKFARTVAPLGFEAVKIGASPYFDLTQWNPRGNKAKKMRVGCNQARKSGVLVQEVEKIDLALEMEVKNLSQCWLKTRRAEIEFGWLFELNPFRHAQHKKFFVARNEENRLVGLLAASPIPARQGWYLEDILRFPDSPNGTTDLLIFEALKFLSERGEKLATLGTVPLAVDGQDDFSNKKYPLSKMLFNFSRQNGEFIYNFKGLRHFKGKFVPTWWESEYILLPKGLFIPPRIANTFFHAILPNGLLSLFKSKLN
ncbi:MAG TPA: DUF2156 domain-containing protein [Pyrinomonadaceae bacterium]|nr:DUF2156 domain-containing protein [Pyrinomonadaceae bacterium]